MLIIYKNFNENPIRNGYIDHILADSLKCACGHSKLEHEKRGCIASGCGCEGYNIKKEFPEEEALNKHMKSMVVFSIDATKLYRKHRKPAGKSGRKQVRRSDDEDRVEKIFTEIRELGSDYKQKIVECDKVIKNPDALELELIKAFIEKGIALKNDNRAAESLQCFDMVLLKDEKKY